MRPAARIAAAIDVLDRILVDQPAEQALTNWARNNRFAGSGDRAAIRDHVFDALRCRRSAAARGGAPEGVGSVDRTAEFSPDVASSGRALMLGLLREAGKNPAEIFTGLAHAPAPLSVEEANNERLPVPGGEALDVQDWTLPLFRQTLGDRCECVLGLMRRRAPVFLRVNLRKATMPQVRAALVEEGVDCAPHQLSPTALICDAHPRGLNQRRAFIDGWVELQDAASQAVVDLLPVLQGARVLDYCAGGGGKALALAARCDATIFAHDAAPDRMRDLPARAARAGVLITQLDTTQARRNGPYDLVLCDVPCSGSGSWRRAPEAKWTLDAARLQALQSVQAQILDDAAKLTGPDGVLAYATCSLFPSENRLQIDSFLTRHPQWRLLNDRLFTPEEGGDGFYTAHLTRRNG